MASSGSSNLPRPSRSRLPISVSNTGARLGAIRDQPTAGTTSCPHLVGSPSTPRVPKNSAVRSRTIVVNAKSTQSPSEQVPERLRTKSITKSPHTRLKQPEQATPPKVPVLSMKEAIALKRTEAKKVLAAQRAFSEHDGAIGMSIEDASPTTREPVVDDDDLGRLSIREMIERARSSGSLNIASRDLLCLPSALFEIHLSVTPEKLSRVPDEPNFPEKHGKKVISNPTLWYEQQDLTFIRARNNQIVELQPEISLFGSLKTIDLQNNRLVSLPESFADLLCLVNLDLSHNALTSLPSQIFSLPALLVLDLSHNSLTTLPFNMPFDTVSKLPRPSRRSSGFFSAPDVVRATRPLPCLASLDVSYNKIVSSAVHHNALPQDLRTFNLARNPLGHVAELLTSLSTLSQLVDLRMSGCTIDDTSFPDNLLSSSNRPAFPNLSILDLEETLATQAAVSRALSNLTQTIDFEASIADARTVPIGTVAVTVGKRIAREAWEIEADRHVQRLREKRSAVILGGTPTQVPLQSLPEPYAKERRAPEVEQDLLSEGPQPPSLPAEVIRPAVGTPTTVAPDAITLLRRYWEPRTHTLTLPPSAGRSLRRTATFVEKEDELPRATLPLTLITTQSFADTLRVLELRSRRAEPVFILPACNSQPLLPCLETLNLEGCALSDVVPCSGAVDGGTLGVLAQLFPSLRNLELAYNNLTSAAVTRGVLEQLLFMDDGGRVGLRRLGLCGNKIEELNGLCELAQLIFGVKASSYDVERRRRWTLEELDVRENSIIGLPGELGLLPLESFLVDGNLFRVPPRRVWEREGTKGLLIWLLGRLDTQGSI
ncbi:L domain-like protein [Russula earlei]|uniref:L domain-like protein n=1 Tax=Russula earlei TaxID=71964 RepID=A0ACC0TX53_9AGAM|nr:L domain-like protein [Russula earlei]